MLQQYARKENRRLKRVFGDRFKQRFSELTIGVLAKQGLLQNIFGKRIGQTSSKKCMISKLFTDLENGTRKNCNGPYVKRNLSDYFGIDQDKNFQDQFKDISEKIEISRGENKSSCSNLMLSEDSWREFSFYKVLRQDFELYKEEKEDGITKSLITDSNKKIHNYSRFENFIRDKDISNSYEKKVSTTIEKDCNILLENIERMICEKRAPVLNIKDEKKYSIQRKDGFKIEGEISKVLCASRLYCKDQSKCISFNEIQNDLNFESLITPTDHTRFTSFNEIKTLTSNEQLCHPDLSPDIISSWDKFECHSGEPKNELCYDYEIKDFVSYLKIKQGQEPNSDLASHRPTSEKNTTKKVRNKQPDRSYLVDAIFGKKASSVVRSVASKGASTSAEGHGLRKAASTTVPKKERSLSHLREGPKSKSLNRQEGTSAPVFSNSAQERVVTPLTTNSPKVKKRVDHLKRIEGLPVQSSRRAHSFQNVSSKKYDKIKNELNELRRLNSKRKDDEAKSRISALEKEKEHLERKLESSYAPRNIAATNNSAPRATADRDNTENTPKRFRSQVGQFDNLNGFNNPQRDGTNARKINQARVGGAQEERAAGPNQGPPPKVSQLKFSAASPFTRELSQPESFQKYKNKEMKIIEVSDELKEIDLGKILNEQGEKLAKGEPFKLIQKNKKSSKNISVTMKPKYSNGKFIAWQPIIRRSNRALVEKIKKGPYLALTTSLKTFNSLLNSF